MSLFWSFQKIPNLLDKLDPFVEGCCLGEEERVAYGKLKVPKRRTEWLGGRLALKELVRQADSRYAGLAANQIEVLNESSGAPRLAVLGCREPASSISLSHSHDHVFSLYSQQEMPLGADLEWIEPRAEEFAEDYFTGGEIEQVRKAPEKERPSTLTVIWSGKEAAFKALSLGLRADTRSVQVLLPQWALEFGGWLPLSITSNQSSIQSLSLFWRREGNFVLTICLPTGQVGILQRISA